MAYVKFHNEVCEQIPNGWTLCFQRCTYHLDDDTTEEGYRFIWRRPGGTLQAARGQARIPNAAIMQRLTNAAKDAGWLV